jgi:hypothetical protein
MFDLTANTPLAHVSAQDHHKELESARDLYARARSHGRWRRFWSNLVGRPRHLYRLADVESTCTVQDRSHAGLRTVPIDQIRGSEGRSDDFDPEFCPLQDHNSQRWLRIARARHRGTVLPPVDLIKVGDLYFVRDGHHRVSVARAAGQMDIEAQVTAWQVAGTLPWESQRPTARLSPDPQWAPQPAA